MEKTEKELKWEEMEKVTGGEARPLTARPHCKACRNVTEILGTIYRCKIGWCRDRGKDKMANEVDWY